MIFIKSITTCGAFFQKTPWKIIVLGAFLLIIISLVGTKPHHAQTLDW